MKEIVKKIPIIGTTARYIYRKWINPIAPFTNSANYWESRYETGGTSGDGSYGKLAEFKAKVLNDFVASNKIESVIEYGCGDGNQLKLARYPRYLGFDVSSKAITLCKKTFEDDKSKSFKIAEDYQDETSELTLSLDVIYHLIEEDIFEKYMHRLFDSSTSYVIIYSSNSDDQVKTLLDHVKHRNFTKWVEKEVLDWRLEKHIKNEYPFNKKSNTGSHADFYIYKKLV